MIGIFTPSMLLAHIVNLFIYLFIYLFKKGEAQLYQENKLCTEVKIDCTLKCKYRFGSTKEHQLGFLFPLQYSLSDFSLLSKRVVYRLQASLWLTQNESSIV